MLHTFASHMVSSVVPLTKDLFANPQFLEYVPKLEYATSITILLLSKIGRKVIEFYRDKRNLIGFLTYFFFKQFSDLTE